MALRELTGDEAGAQSEPSGERVVLSAAPRKRLVTRAMTTPEMFARALPRLPFKSQGRLRGGRPIQATRVHQTGLRLDPSRIRDYRQVCTYRAEPGLVPLPYPEIHFTPLMAEAIVSPHFPLSPLGLIHTRQVVRVHEPLRPGDRVDATAELAEIRRTVKGYEVDFSMALSRRSTLVWSGVATLLSRAPGVRGGGVRAHREPPDLSFTAHTRVLDVPECTGRDYARASGDWNPHHLWAFTARPLGYRKPIAHGMWTLARALTHALTELPGPVAVEASVEFRKPLLMPGRMRLDVAPLQSGDGPVQLCVRDPESGSPYLVGTCSLRD